MRHGHEDEPQIIGILREHEAGAKTADLPEDAKEVHEKAKTAIEGSDAIGTEPAVAIARRVELAAAELIQHDETAAL